MRPPRKSIGARRNPESEAAILRAARELIAEEGLAGFSIEAVARRARAGKPTIYRWWPSRTLLLLDVYAGLKEDLHHAAAGPLVDDLASFLADLLRFWQAGAGDVFRSLLAQAQTDDVARDALRAFNHERRERTAAMLAEPRPGEVPLTPAQAGRLADLVFSYALRRLLMGELAMTADESRAVAATLAAGARAAD